MARFYSVGILALFAFAASCGGTGRSTANAGRPTSANQTADAVNAPKTNVEELGVLLTIPYETEDIVWKQDPVSKRITAVMRFSPADAAKLVAAAGTIRPPQKMNVASESWFPAELIAQGEMSGDGTLNGLSYAADGFLQPPFNAGAITRIENTDYFLLEASVK